MAEGTRERTREGRRLTAKQRTFLGAYLGRAHGNATEAARLAGYGAAKQRGWKLLRVPAIAAEIRAEQARRQMETDELLARLSDIARNRATDYLRVKPDGRLEWDLEGLVRDGYGHCLKRVRNTPYGLQVETLNSQAALMLLGRMLGIPGFCGPGRPRSLRA